MNCDNEFYNRIRKDDDYNFMGMYCHKNTIPFSKNLLKRFSEKNNLAIFGTKSIVTKSPYIFSLECDGTLPRTSLLHTQGIYKGYVKFCQYFCSKSKGLYMGYYIRIHSPTNECEQEDLVVFLKVTDEILAVIPNIDEQQYKIKIFVDNNKTGNDSLGSETIIDLYPEER